MTRALGKGRNWSRKHGLAGTPTYDSWRSMHRRCRPDFNGCSAYFDRGITVCERWGTFENFVADMGVRPPGTSLDRIDNAGNYEPGNCRWATPGEQARNTKANRMIAFNGEVLCVTDWAAKLGISRSALSHRLKTGWPIEAALTLSSDRQNRAAVARKEG